MKCRAGCGACCIAPSITSAIPGMPDGKAAGERCIHLDTNNMCGLFDDDSRPAVCDAFNASPDACGDSFEAAMKKLQWMELATGADY